MRLFTLSKRVSMLLTSLALVVLIIGGSPGTLSQAATAPVPVYTAGMIVSRAGEFEALRRSFTAGVIKRLIVTLRAPGYQAEGTLSNAAAVQNQRRNVLGISSTLMSRLSSVNARLVIAYDTMPIAVIEVDANAIPILSTAPEVASVVEDTPHPGADLGTNNVIGAPNAWAQGYDGTGWAVAVVDSGVQKTHPFLSGKVVAEVCFSSAQFGSTSICPNGQSTSGSTPGQSGAGSGVNCPVSIDGCAHGTHVAGIAAGKNYSGGPGYDGVARGANIVAVQVFSQFTGSNCTGFGHSSPCALYWNSDLIAALNYVYTTLSASTQIAAVNMSLVSTLYSGSVYCNDEPMKPAIDNLRSINIASVVSAGNNGSIGMTAPACIQTAISVGSTEDNDAVASYSNRNSLTTLFAPGSQVNSSVPDNTYADYWGTSMAAPHVAGAFAVMRQKLPTATIDKIVNIFRGKGVPITTDGFTIPRLKLDTALADFGNRDTIGIFRRSNTTFYLRNSNSTGVADESITFGASTDFPITGDWNGDGIDTPGVYRQTTGQFFLTDSTSDPAALTYSLVLGVPNDQPLVGDWNGDGKDSVGVFRPSNGLIYLRNALTTGVADYTMVLGVPGDVGLSGDWDGDGKDSPGVYRPSNQVFYLTNSICNCSVFADAQLGLGLAGDTPFVGDWDRDGKTGVGVYRQSNGITYLKNALTTGFADLSFVFGSANDYPLAGFWVSVSAPGSEPAPTFQPQ
ncbi:MAG: S8 family serine peptidase [Anaerolineae bacterium]|nr:S8 family serine peptidase [Anaerolineae bacterium]